MVDGLIEQVVSGKQSMVGLPLAPIDRYISVLSALGYEYGEWETNGYQVDYWLYFTKEGHPTLLLEGDLWYLDAITLRVI